MTRPQLLGCAMPLQQHSLNTTLLSSTPVSSASPLTLLPPGDLPESPCISQASLKSSNPTKQGKVFLSPPS